MDKKQQELHIVKVLGKGAFGEVQLVRNEVGMEFALKKVHLGSKADIEQSLQEAMFMFKLNHKNIVRFQQVFKDENGISILMEYAAGGSLYDKVVEANAKGEQLSEGQILKWTGQLANALSYLHKNNIIHRDIKPQNVLLDSKGVLKLADLGISKVLENTMGNAKTFAGTKAYMSPEMLDEEPYDCKVDIWSLGIMLYQMLTYKLPFKKVSDQVRGIYIPLPASVSPIFHELTKITLEVDPMKRPSAKEIKKIVKESPLAKEVSPKKSTTGQTLYEELSTLRISRGTTVSEPKTISFQNESTIKAEEDETNKYKKGLESKLVKTGRAKYGNFDLKKFPEDGIPREFREWTELENRCEYQGEWRKDTNVPHGSGVMKFRDGSIHEGFFRNGKAEFKGRRYSTYGGVLEGEWGNNELNGQGTSYTKTGAKYTGAWKDGKKHGYGIEIDERGSKYEGHFENGNRHGKGTHIHTIRKETYVGDWEKNEMHGFGNLKKEDGDEYTGDFLYGKKHGKGVYTKQNGERYEGKYANDRRHGLGTNTWKDGRKYNGSWDDNKEHGIGTFTDAKGVTGKGEWKEGELVKWLSEEKPSLNIISSNTSITDFFKNLLKNEQQNKYDKGLDSEIVQKARAKWGNFDLGKFPEDGTVRVFRDWLTIEDGSSYQGEWRKDKNVIHGRGVMKMLSGSVYEGFFRNGAAEIKGRTYLKSGGILEGEYAQNTLNGQGTSYSADGSKYVGEWKDGREHGYAIQTLSDGTRYEGYFENGDKSGKGSYIYTDGATHVGSFEKNKKHGPGVFKLASGAILSGEWKDGNQHGIGLFTNAEGVSKKAEWSEGKIIKILDTPDSETETAEKTKNDSATKVEVDDSSKYEKGLESQLMKDGRAKYGIFELGKFPEDGIPREFREWTTFQNGTKYQGEWRKDTNAFHGRGIFMFGEGSLYEGFFRNGQLDIKGRKYLASGAVYEGTYSNSGLNGQGILYDADGAKYIGEWKDDKQHGFGKHILPDGSIYEGYFENGEKKGKGSFTTANGTYVGYFEKSKFHGSGTFTLASGAILAGEWKDGNQEGIGSYTDAEGVTKKVQWSEGKLVKFLD